MNYKKSALLLLVVAALYSCSHSPDKKTPSAANVSKSVATGQVIYTNNCVSCHQIDGGGVQHMNPPLVKTTYVLGDKTELIKIVLNGFNKNVDINGSTYSNVMASHDFLKDQEIADVLTYVRNSFGNKADAITVDEVKDVRASNKK